MKITDQKTVFTLCDCYDKGVILEILTQRIPM